MRKEIYKLFKQKANKLYYSDVSLNRINSIEEELDTPSFGRLFEELQYQDELVVIGIMKNNIMIAEALCSLKTDILEFDIPLFLELNIACFILDKKAIEFTREQDGFTKKYISDNLWYCNCDTFFVRSLERRWCNKCGLDFITPPSKKIQPIKKLMSELRSLL